MSAVIIPEVQKAIEVQATLDNAAYILSVYNKSTGLWDHVACDTPEDVRELIKECGIADDFDSWFVRKMVTVNSKAFVHGTELLED